MASQHKKKKLFRCYVCNRPVDGPVEGASRIPWVEDEYMCRECERDKVQMKLPWRYREEMGEQRDEEEKSNNNE
jgi:hypothetical protein